MNERSNRRKILAVTTQLKQLPKESLKKMSGLNCIMIIKLMLYNNKAKSYWLCHIGNANLETLSHLTELSDKILIGHSI